MKRWIAHVDMDAFFAAVEQRDQPELKGQAVIIGGLSERGVVSTASYEARLFGVRSAMPMVEARRRCPQGVFLPCNHRHYAAVSRDIRRIMNDFSPLVEPLSLDEAFLDLTGMEWLHSDIAELPRQLTKRIYEEVGLTASAGLAPNKFLAKIASDLKKPHGYVIVRHGEEASFLAPLPIRRLWGIGPKSAAKLTQLGIDKIGQLAKLPGNRQQSEFQRQQDREQRRIPEQYRPDGNHDHQQKITKGRQALHRSFPPDFLSAGRPVPPSIEPVR